MAHWPKTVRGNLYAFLFAVIAVLFLVQAAVALSGPVVWTLVAALVLMSAALYIWNRRVRAAGDVAVTDAPSFGDVLRRADVRRRIANDARELARP